MHCRLDVYFEEDWCRIEDKKVQQNLNMIRKVAFNLIKEYKTGHKSKRPISYTMLECLINDSTILKVIFEN